MHEIFKRYTVDLDEEKRAVVIINQEKLPAEEELLYLYTQQEIWTAIKRLQVRGAPAIGITAAFGLYLAALEIEPEVQKEAADANVAAAVGKIEKDANAAAAAEKSVADIKRIAAGGKALADVNDAAASGKAVTDANEAAAAGEAVTELEDFSAAEDSGREEKGSFFDSLRQAKEYLASSRPTAVNLFWALERMENAALAHRGESIPAIREAMHAEAIAMRDEDVRVCRAIGEYGAGLISDGMGILTHCNAGKLAAVDYGTALAPIYRAKEMGYTLNVFADETRPQLQGARLTAAELAAAGVDVTLICDNMASQVMKNGWVQAVFVGCDRVAANGDVCNKIGTSGAAILANYYGIPVYVCAPISTIDMHMPTGAEIPIEQRNPKEVTDMWYEKRMAPEGIGVFNPAFDVTDHTLVAALITEYGIIRPPYEENLQKLFSGRSGSPT